MNLIMLKKTLYIQVNSEYDSIYISLKKEAKLHSLIDDIYE